MDIFDADSDNIVPLPLVAPRAGKRQALERFEEALRQLKDPRRKLGRRYPLRSVVVTALLAFFCGADDAQALEVWGESNKPRLAEFLDLPQGVPTQDVFLAVFAALAPSEFQLVFLSWVHLLKQEWGEAPKHITMDGKAARCSFDKTLGKSAIHTVSAWLTSEGCVIGQLQTDTKSNEITAIPELLKKLDIKGATVSSDAMGCQTEIARGVVEREGHYLLAVKENQPTLYQEILETFAEADDPRKRADDEEQRPTVETFSTTEKGHGRLEERMVRKCTHLEWILDKERWKNLGVLVEVRSTRTDLRTGKSSEERRYYIGDNKEASVEERDRNSRSRVDRKRTALGAGHGI